MSATDPQVPINEVKVLGRQGLLGESNTASTMQPQPDPVGPGPAQLSPEMEGFYAIVNLPNSKFGRMMKAGFTSPGDLEYFDKSIINQLSVRLSSKAQLKNYIKWRDQYLGFASEDLEYITVTPEELANVW